MKKYNQITPEGTRDLLFDESLAQRQIEKSLADLFKGYGYSEVITPTIEFYDVFNDKTKYFSQESMYKLTDSKGRLLVIRPDSTLPIARLAATRLKDLPLPLKLYYNQNIFKVNPKDSGRDDEISQSGIELIGGDERLSDFEVLVLAIEVLEKLDSKNYRFEIGSSTFFRLLAEDLKVDEETSITIKSLVETKNYPELNKLLNSLAESDTAVVLRELPKLFGGAEVFEKAEKIFKTPELKKHLNQLSELFNQLCIYGKKDRLFVDFSFVNKADFYSGMIFRGYTEGYGKPVLEGGRYDTLISNFGLDLPATGFAVNVNAAINALLGNKKTEKETLIFIEDSDLPFGMKKVKEFIQSNEKIIYIPLNNREDVLKYARDKGIEKIIAIKNHDHETIKVRND